MKILFTHRPGGAYAFISDGWMNACRAAGFTVARWDGAESSWNAYDPDIYVGCSGHRQPIPAERRAKVAIHCNPFGPRDLGPINESQNAIAWTNVQRPAAVFGYGHELDRVYWEHWTTKLGIPWVPMPNAGDSTIYKKVDDNDRYDIVYLGGRWDYKAKNIDKYLLPILKRTNSVGCTYSYKVCGWGGWPSDIPNSRLPETPGADVALYGSGTIAPCVSEPHTSVYGIDLPERVFKAALCGCLTIHDFVPGFAERFMPSVIVAKDEHEYATLIEEWQHRRDMRDRAELQRREVLNGHTYFHRMAGLLNALGFTGGADQLLTAARRFGTESAAC